MVNYRYYGPDLTRSNSSCSGQEHLETIHSRVAVACSTSIAKVLIQVKLLLVKLTATTVKLTCMTGSAFVSEIPAAIWHWLIVDARQLLEDFHNDGYSFQSATLKLTFFCCSCCLPNCFCHFRNCRWRSLENNNETSYLNYTTDSMSQNRLFVHTTRTTQYCSLLNGFIRSD